MLEETELRMIARQPDPGATDLRLERLSSYGRKS